MVKNGLILLSLILVVGVLYGLSQQIISSLQAGRRLEVAEEELGRAKVRNEELKKALEEISSLQFIESQARNKLNMGRIDEVTVIIPDKVINKFLEDKKLKTEKSNLPNYQAWLKLFFP